MPYSYPESLFHFVEGVAYIDEGRWALAFVFQLVVDFINWWMSFFKGSVFLSKSEVVGRYKFAVFYNGC